MLGLFCLGGALWMSYVYWAIVSAFVVAILIALKTWEKLKNPRSLTNVKGIRENFRQAWAEADDYVKRADSWAPYLVGNADLGTKPNPYFFGGFITSAVLLMFAAAGGYAIGNGNIFYSVIAFCVMAIVQILQAVVSIAGDKGQADFWEVNAADRSASSWALLILLLFANIVMSVMGSVSVGSQAHQQAQIKTSTLQSDLQQVETLKLKIKQIDERQLRDGEGLSAEALRTKWKAAKEEAIRESWRSRTQTIVDQEKVDAGEYGPTCGEKCQALQAEAAKYKALFDDASRRPSLQQQLRRLNNRLAQSSGVSADGVAWANNLESISGGYINKDSAAKSAWTVFQMFIALLDFVLWLRVGDTVKSARSRVYDGRAEEANASLVAQGYEERYRRAPKKEEPNGMIIDGSASEVKVPDSYQLTVQQDADAIIAASPGLQEIDQFFLAFMIPKEGNRLPLVKCYQAFKAGRTAAGVHQHTGHSDFISNLKRYCELKSHSVEAGHLVGWDITGKIERGVDNDGTTEAV